MLWLLPALSTLTRLIPLGLNPRVTSPTSPAQRAGEFRRRAHFSVFILSVTACVQAPVGSFVITGSEPLASNSFTVRV
jgi:hypothetical protein